MAQLGGSGAAFQEVLVRCGLGLEDQLPRRRIHTALGWGASVLLHRAASASLLQMIQGRSRAVFYNLVPVTPACSPCSIVTQPF